MHGRTGECGAIKPIRLDDLRKNGAVAAFVPFDLNVCTTRGAIDILGVSKEIAHKLLRADPLLVLKKSSQKNY